MATGSWSITDIPNLSGRKAIVTGANSGVGYYTALELARAGAEVTLAVRNMEKGKVAAENIRRELPQANIRLSPLDLADLSSVRAFATTYATDNATLHLLINNAGIMMVPARQLTVDSFEAHMGTMHFGHYALTGLLWPIVSRTPNARVVTVSSIVHKSGRIDFENLEGQKRYSMNASYSQAKLANLMFGLELHRRCTAARIGVRSILAHPGVAATNLQTTGPQMGGGAPPFRARLLKTLAPLLFQSAQRAAIPSLYAATATDAESGGYYGPDGFMEMAGARPKRAMVAKQAQDTGVASQLWDISAARTGVHFL
jgi:NAD(P)-dependent dehydrogenase (short-subunit alcohol dehydrogenase family)